MEHTDSSTRPAGLAAVSATTLLDRPRAAQLFLAVSPLVPLKYLGLYETNIMVIYMLKYHIKIKAYKSMVIIIVIVSRYQAKTCRVEKKKRISGFSGPRSG